MVGVNSICLTCPELCGNCAIPQNFHGRKLGQVKVFYTVLLWLGNTVTDSGNVFKFFQNLRN